MPYVVLTATKSEDGNTNLRLVKVFTTAEGATKYADGLEKDENVSVTIVETAEKEID